jgi:hypothetical protein
MWSPARLIVVGAIVVAVALALGALARAFEGPFDPSCRALFCGGVASAALQILALVVGLYGAVLVGMGLARREPPPEYVDEGEPPSPPDDPRRAP